MTRRTRTIPVALVLALAFGIAAGQEGADEAQRDTAETGTSETASFDEEIVVRGRSRAMIRMQIQLAEEAVYARFNDINSNDEFDIHCRREILTGSNIPRRVCQPNLWRNALREAGQETTRAFQGSSAFSSAQFQAEALYKNRLMTEELERLVRQDDQLRNAVTRLASLTGEMNEQRGERTLPAAAAARVVNAEDEPLPYGATVMANVWIRREPWSHELTYRIFTIANVFGDIEALELHCANQSERIAFEEGAEWSVPDGWDDCSVTVEADPGTTFALYEFE